MIELLKKYCRGDKYMWTCIVMLLIASIVAVGSSSTVLAYVKNHGDITGTILRHYGFLAFGVVVMMTMSNVPMKYIGGWSPLALLGALGLLGAVYVFGSSINGSARWLRLGPVQFQPSEFAKLALIIFVARQLALNLATPDKALKTVSIAIGCVAGLVMMENLSTCLLILASCSILLLIGRVSWYWVFGAGGVAVVLVALLLLLAPYPPIKTIFPRAATWRARVERYINVDESQQTGKSDNYQAEQSAKAIAIGGFRGAGPGNSTMKNYLPMAFSDFIFAIILEEWGIGGMAWILLAYGCLLGRAVVLSRHCTKPFHTYAMLGIMFLLTLQAIINMFVAVGLMPVTGQTLPMVSMGGTSNVLTGMALGIVLSISADVNETIAAEAENKKQTEQSQKKRQQDEDVEEFDETESVSYN